MDGYESGYEVRVYLDTNIVIYFLYNRDELSSDFSVRTRNDTFGSNREGTEIRKREKVLINPETIIDNIYEAGINIVKVEENHLSTLASLSMYEDHRDSNDRLIRDIQ